MKDNYIGPEEIIEKKNKYLIPCSYHFYASAPQIVSGSMQYLYDSTGKRYIDFFAGVSVMNCGHCNSEINSKVIKQMNSLQHTSTIYLTEQIVNLAEKLSEVTPGNLKRSFFCNSGSEANEEAMLLAKIYSGHSEFLSLYNSLHGRTHLTMSATGLGMWRADPDPYGGMCFIQNPYCFRCPFNKVADECCMECVDAVDNAIRHATSGKIAAMIAEPIQANGGIITPPKGYFKALKTVLDKYKILLIIDEVQTGFGRTGKMFAIENYDVVPDIMTMAKSLGNGVPIGACITTDEIASKFTMPSASTLGGNPVSTCAGIAVLDYIKENKLVQRAQMLGEKLKNGLLGLKEKHKIIGDVRGIGLMQGIELVSSNKEPATKECDIILEKLKDAGILVGKNGEFRNVLAFQPPLVINEEDIEILIKKLDKILEI
jgi:4-aminobutyrate aminotransferase-like enzyme